MQAQARVAPASRERHGRADDARRVALPARLALGEHRHEIGLEPLRSIGPWLDFAQPEDAACERRAGPGFDDPANRAAARETRRKPAPIGGIARGDEVGRVLSHVLPHAPSMPHEKVEVAGRRAPEAGHAGATARVA